MMKLDDVQYRLMELDSEGKAVFFPKEENTIESGFRYGFVFVRVRETGQVCVYRKSVEEKRTIALMDFEKQVKTSHKEAEPFLSFAWFEGDGDQPFIREVVHLGSYDRSLENYVKKFLLDTDLIWSSKLFFSEIDLGFDSESDYEYHKFMIPSVFNSLGNYGEHGALVLWMTAVFMAKIRSVYTNVKMIEVADHLLIEVKPIKEI